MFWSVSTLSTKMPKKIYETAMQKTDLKNAANYWSSNKKTLQIFFDLQCWWGKVDSNHRSRRQQIYSLPHLTALEFPHIQFGAGGRIRTPDLLITNQLLYQLSYTSGLHDQQQDL